MIFSHVFFSGVETCVVFFYGFTHGGCFVKHQSYVPKEFYGPLGQGGATGKFDMSEFKGPVPR